MMQCRAVVAECGVDLSSEREDDQDDVSRCHQVNDRTPGNRQSLDNVERCVLEPPGRAGIGRRATLTYGYVPM